MEARKLSAILLLKVNKTDKNDAGGIAEAPRSRLYTSTLQARRIYKYSYGIRLGSISAKKFSSTVIKQVENC